jgi:hypothetical protein
MGRTYVSKIVLAGYWVGVVVVGMGGCVGMGVGIGLGGVCSLCLLLKWGKVVSVFAFAAGLPSPTVCQAALTSPEAELPPVWNPPGTCPPPGNGCPLNCPPPGTCCPLNRPPLDCPLNCFPLS